MNIKKSLLVGMLGLMPLTPVKAQKAIQFIPEAGAFGNIKAAPTMIGGVNAAFPKKNNFADVFVGATLNSQATPGFAGIAFDNFNWSKNFSSWARDLFLASKNGVTSNLDVAPIKYNTSAGKFNFSVMPAYGRVDDFVNHTTTHNIKAIFQSMFSITPKDRLCLEMQYGSIPAANISDTRFGSFADSFNFTATYSRVLGK